MEDIKGKKIIAFNFAGGPGFNSDMEKKIGQIGLIQKVQIGFGYCVVVFLDNSQWSYPYPEILNHIIPKEEETDINKLFNSVIKLIKEIK